MTKQPFNFGSEYVLGILRHHWESSNSIDAKAVKSLTLKEALMIFRG